MGSRTGLGKVLMSTSVPLTDMAMEQAVQRMQDTQRRALLLRAQAGVIRRQQRVLQDPTQRLQNQLKRLQDIERWASGAGDQHSPGSADILGDPVLCPDPSSSEFHSLGFNVHEARRFCHLNHLYFQCLERC